MSDIHPVFHISQLRRCLKVLEEKRVPVENIDLQPDLRYQEVPVMILDTVVKRTRTTEVRVCRVQWSRHGVEEATWEREDALKKEFPHLFETLPNLEDKIHFKWGRFVTPAFLAPNKSPNKSCVLSKLSSRAQLPPSNPSHSPSLSPRRACRESRRHRQHPGPAPTRAFPTPRSATVPGIPRTPRSRRPVRLAITAVPKITPTPRNHKTPQKSFPYFS
jgi:hypothetical protein